MPRCLLDPFKVANSAQYYRPDYHLNFRAFWTDFDPPLSSISFLLLNYLLLEPSQETRVARRSCSAADQHRPAPYATFYSR